MKFLARGLGYTLFLTGEEAVLSLRSQKPVRQPTDRGQKEEKRPWSVVSGPSQETTDNGQWTTDVVQMNLLGANRAAKVTALDELPGKSNYFIGNDPKMWRTDLPTYAKVRYEAVYPGIDLVYYGKQGKLEYDFVVAPGADPKAITLGIETGNSKLEVGSSKIEDRNIQIDANGDLVIQAESGEVRFHKPLVYQPRDTRIGAGNSEFTIQNSEFINGRYVLAADNRIHFEVSGYDKSKPLIIDPVLNYSTYLGGSGGDAAYGIAVDSSDDAYIAGTTNSSNFPLVSAEQSTYGGSGDAFVAKFNSSGSALVYSTYLGGSGADIATAIAVSTTDDAFVTGNTTSPNFPIAPAVSSTSTGAFQQAYGGNTDAFVAQLNSTGNGLVYSSYLGGSGADFGQGIAVDSSGNAYVTGSTQSANFPTVNPLQPGSGGSSDVFVAKVNFAGTALIYSTYLGGSEADTGQAITIDSSGNAYIVGYTFSSNFPTHNPLQGSNLGTVNAFVAEVNTGGSALVFSTYLGGSSDDRGLGIALDASHNIYVTGVSKSTNFPTTTNAFQPSNRGGSDAFVSKLNSTGSALTYSTLLGGSGFDQGNGIAVDSSGDAFVTGFTQSSDFPTSNATQAIMGITGGTSCGVTLCSDAFVSKLNPSGTALLYSTFLGGSAADFGQGIALDSSGDAYVGGSTLSSNFPVLSNFSGITGPYQGTLGGAAGNAFAAMISPSNAPGLAFAPGKVAFGNQALSVPSPAQTVTVINEGTAPLTISEITSSSTDFAESDNCVGTVGVSGGTCTINLTFTPSSLGAVTDQITVTDNSASSPQNITVTGTGVTAATSVTVAPTSITFPNATVGTVTTAQTVTITNSGTAVLNITQISVTGDFTQTNTCGATLNVLNVGQSCSVSVIFAPTGSGTRSGTLSISDNATGSPQTVALTGTGLAVFSLTAVTTQTVLVGSTTATYTIYATAPSTFTGSISFTCSSPASCTFNPTAIFGGQSTTLTLGELSPTTPQPFNFSVNGISGSQTFTLPLTLLLADYTMTATPTLDTVVSGSPAKYDIILTPSNGFNQQVGFTCSNLPLQASCAFSPSPVTPNGAPVGIALTIRTIVAPSTSPWQRWTPLGGVPPPIAFCVACLGLLASLLALYKRRGNRAVALSGSPWTGARLMFLGLVLALAALVGSCRGVYSPGGTPSGNYSITVNGTLTSNPSVVRYVTVNLAVTPTSTT